MNEEVMSDHERIVYMGGVIAKLSADLAEKDTLLMWKDIEISQLKARDYCCREDI